MDASRGFLSGTVDKFKMVRISVSVDQLLPPVPVFLTITLLDRFSRRNQAAGWQPWWHPSLLSSCSYTTLPSSSMAVLALRSQPMCVAACDDVYCLIVWSHFFALNDQSVGSRFSNALFVWTYQQNQQPSSSVFLSQQTSEQCF
jgi:hypothetical protein